MNKSLLVSTFLVFEVVDNIDELYRDADYYTLIFWWGLTLVTIGIILGRGIYKGLKSKH